VPAIIGFAEALKITDEMKRPENLRLKKLQNEFIEKLAEKIPSAQINGSMKHRLVNNVHVTFPGADNERLLMQLDEAGIYASAGSACSAKSSEPSHVLRSIGLTDEQARSSIRFSLGRDTTPQDIEKTIASIQRNLPR
jgi:cysteine desulfurase